MLKFIRVLSLLVLGLPSGGRGEPRPEALDAVAGSSAETGGSAAPEISTRDLRAELAAGRALIFDARSPAEFATGHLPGALNVAGKPGLPPSQYTSDLAPIEKLVKGNRAQPIILYCNGLYCGRSRRLADDLIAAGFTNVRRYQLGMPVWRALGGVQQIELQALLQVLKNDRTAVVLDARGKSGFPGGRPLLITEVRQAKDDGRLPMDDHHTRIIVVGASAAQAQALAEGVAADAFDNVAFFGGEASLVERAITDSDEARSRGATAPRPRRQPVASWLEEGDSVLDAFPGEAYPNLVKVQLG
jgi:rhodanese-related sulfurtransferase